jgi:hypothetical protein
MVTSEAARAVQRPGASMRIRLLTVGLLAVLGLSACGVGVDENGAMVTATSQSALLGPDGQPGYVGGNGGPPIDPRGGGAASLPQDPVPIHGLVDLTLVPPVGPMGEPKLTP